MTSTAKLYAAAPTQRRARAKTDTVQLAIACVLIILSGLIPDLAGNDYWTLSFQLVNLFIAVAALQNLLMHDAGQTSFGQGAIFGVSAYCASVVASTYGLPYWQAACCGVLAAVLAGFLYALPSLRVQGYYLGFVTMSAATVFPEMLVAANRYTNGINGITLNFSALHERTALGVSPMTLMVCGIACAVLAAHVLLRRTALGRRLRVAANSPEAAQSLGVSPGLMRCLAFLIVAFGTGIVGTLYTPVVGFISPAAFHIDASILFFLAVIVGGRGHILGTVVGVWVLYLLPNILLAELAQYRLLVYGAVALVVMLLMPDGIVGTFERWRLRRRTSQPLQSVGLERLLEFHRGPGAAGERPGAVTGNAIDVRAATKRYGSVSALDSVDLTVRNNHIHGLVGANGSGKTTLLNMLSGFSRLDSGSVRVAGQEVRSMPAHRIARLGLGRTFQKPRIFSTMSLWENVEIGIDAAHKHTHSASLLAALRQAMEEGNVELVPHGQRRLVELMRVVLKGSDIILLDEPAAGLSPSEREQFKKLLCRLRDELGKTIVLVEHDLELVWGIADTITVLEAGKMVAHGSAAEIVDNPFVRKLFIEPTHA
ncbi:MAG: ATP-binding cassette domain-containing protein [Comamonas sp.]